MLWNVPDKYPETAHVIEDNFMEVCLNEKVSAEEVFYIAALLLCGFRLIDGLPFHALVVLF